MGMTIEELITFCEEEEYNHRLSCKRYDDASGYTRSKDKNIRTSCAIREDAYADFYKEISETMRKYQNLADENKQLRASITMMKADYNARLKADMAAMLTELQLEIEELPTNRIVMTDSSGLICYGYSYHEPSAKDASNLIQQKINSLKGEQE